MRGVADFGESNYAGRVFDAVQRVDSDSRTSTLAGGNGVAAADFTHWSLCSTAAATSAAVAASSDTVNGTATASTASTTIVSSACAAADKPLDAVTWFGILPPAGVRACQTNFRSALDSVVELASVVSEMGALEQQWLELHR